MKKISEIVAYNISTLRKTKGWSQAVLAERIDLSTTSVMNFETQRAWPTLETVRRLAEQLGVAEEQLFLDPESKAKPTVKEALDRIAEEAGYRLVKKPKARKDQQASS